MNNISVEVDIILTQNQPEGLIEMNELFEVLYYNIGWIPNSDYYE